MNLPEKLYDERKLSAPTVDDWIVIWNIGSLLHTKGELYNMNEELDDTYKVVFRQCYPKLLFYATRLVGTEEAEDVVQDVFVELWRRRDSVVIGEQILAFLYRSVYTKAINLLKHQIIENNYSAAMIEIYERRLQYYQPDHAEVIKKIENQELRQEIFGAINEFAG